MGNPSKTKNPKSKIHALILAGGGGTRFWPRSRAKFPKQFLTLAGERTLLQQAFDRIEALIGSDHVWVITSSAHQQLCGEQLPAVQKNRVVGEPMGRDTAAAIGLGAALIAKTDPDAVMVAMPADHVIEPAQEFRRAIQAAVQLADEHPAALITFGIPPTFPATGYGYIQRGDALGERLGVTAYQVRQFKEKPDAATAEKYIAGGEYLWNSGIFVWRVRALLDELKINQPDLLASLERIAAGWNSPQQEDVFRKEFEPLKKLSVDFAVMEKAKEVLVLRAPFQWDDVGSWNAIERMHPQDAAGNTIQATHTGLHTKNCLIVGDSGKLIATVGVENLVIVQDGDATLIADKRDEAAIKKLVEHLKTAGYEKYL